MYGVKKVIYSGESKCQKIDVIELLHYGKALVLDGKVQSTTLDEWIYHELLVHPIMITHPNPKRVLIIGGGEGSTAREVLKHKTVEFVEMVDIDAEVIAVSKKYLEEFHKGVFEDRRFSIIIGDGRKYVESLRKENVYDIIIVDATDPLSGGPAYLLYTKEFYNSLSRILSDDGLIITQAQDPEYERACAISIYKTVGVVFPISRIFKAYIPSFDGEWCFVIGSKKYDPAELNVNEVQRRIENRGLKDLKYYHAKLHSALFVLPKYFMEDLEKFEGTKIISDDSPFYVYG